MYWYTFGVVWCFENYFRNVFACCWRRVSPQVGVKGFWPTLVTEFLHNCHESPESPFWFRLVFFHPVKSRNQNHRKGGIDGWMQVSKKIKMSTKAFATLSHLLIFLSIHGHPSKMAITCRKLRNELLFSEWFVVSLGLWSEAAFYVVQIVPLKSTHETLAWNQQQYPCSNI